MKSLPYLLILSPVIIAFQIANRVEASLESLRRGREQRVPRQAVQGVRA